MNKFATLLVLVAAAGFASIVGCSRETPVAEQAPAPRVEAPDFIFTGDNIVTMDPALENVDAVAVRGNTITAVGAREQILASAGESTRLVELGERALVPGFIDTHGHFAFYARIVEFVNLSSPPVGPVENIDDLVARITAHITEREIPDGHWVMGYGYDDSLLAEERHPTRDDLDRVSTEHPIALLHVSGHLAAVNSVALAARGVDANSPDPEGGVIRRREGSMEPNGVLEEHATFPFTFGVMQELSKGRLPEWLAMAIDQHAAYGITTIQDGASTLPDIATMRQAAADQPFAADVVAFPWVSGLTPEQFEALTLEREYQNGFRVGGAKFGLDGSPQGRTAFMTEPYDEVPDGQEPGYVSYPTYDQDAYERQVAELIGRGIPVLAHANGDAAMDMMIGGVEKAVAGATIPDHRSVIIHAQLMRADQLDKAAELGIVPSFFSAHAFFWGDWHRRSFGEERAQNISPMRWAADRGVKFTVHNDAPVVPPDIMRLLWASVNRTTRSGYVLGPQQRLSPREALHAVTLGAAYQYFEEDRKGSITPGKQADLVILEANPLTAPADTIKDIAVLETIARGKTIYSAL